MNRFKNILAVASDSGSLETVVRQASGLARRNGAKLTLLGVVEGGDSRGAITLRDGTEIDIDSYLVDTRREELVAAIEGIDDIPIDVAVESGIGFVEVIRRVEYSGHDLVMVSVDAARRRLVGSSMAMHLLRKCPVPVWVDAGTRRGDDVAVAIGPLSDQTPHDSLNIMLLQLGASLAAIRGGDLHVIHAWRLEGESMLRRGRHRPPAEEVDALVAATHANAESRLADLMTHAPDVGVATHMHLVKGDPHKAITDVLTDEDAGVIVMGTLARTGVTGVFMGNTAERVLGAVDSSVLAVKPEGFVSPVSV